MRSKGLVVMAVAGLLVVAYAFYTLLDSGSSRAERRSTRAESGRSSRSANVEPDAPPGFEDDDRSRGERRGRPAAPPRPAVKVSPPPEPAEPAEPGEAAAGPTPGQPPRPEPEISLPEARQQFEEIMAELDRLAEEGVTLTSPEWVDYYKRGNDALLPLQQHLDWAVADQAAELRKANEDLRAKLRVIEPGGSAAPPP